MPYIPQNRRSISPVTAGDLCYQITQLCQDHLARGFESFTTYGEIRNALFTAWEAHFLPKLQDYEHLKRLQNGDVKSTRGYVRPME